MARRWSGWMLTGVLFVTVTGVAADEVSQDGELGHERQRALEADRSLAAEVSQDGERGQEATSIPSILYTGDSLPHVSAYPIFVSASQAIDEEGNLTDKVSEPLSRSIIQEFLDRGPQQGCYRSGAFLYDRVQSMDRSTLPIAMEEAEVLFVGRVRDRAYGFMFYEAGQLLELKVEEVYRGELKRDSYYIFFPVATFEAGPYRICKTDWQYSAPPKLGDRVLLMLPEPADPSEAYLNLDAPEAILVLGDGGVELPHRFREQQSAPLTAAQLLEKARERPTLEVQ